MDIFAHGLWTGAIYKALNKKTKKPLNLWWAAFWGVFPDLFAFSIGFVWLFWDLIFGGTNFQDFPRPEDGQPNTGNTSPIFQLSIHLYNISHSLIVFLAVSGLVFLIFRRPIWEMGGWLFHILLDIPTHTYRFFPTPIFWPFSGWKFNGISWATPLFLIANYAAIILVYFLLRPKKN